MNHRIVKRVVALLSLVTAVGGATACDGITEPRTPDGSYRLNTVNGRALPARIFEDVGYFVDVVGATIDLRDAGLFTSVMTTRESVDGNVSTYADSTSGTWAMSNGVVAFVVSGDTTKAVWEKQQLTFQTPNGTGGTITYVFGRK